MRCYRCGESLASLSLPFARLDLCPNCNVSLHACRMCRHYAPTAPDACREDDAIEVSDKTTANFCDYFVPNPDAFTGVELAAETAARRQLDALFADSASSEPAGGDSARTETESGEKTGSGISAADALFKD